MPRYKLSPEERAAEKARKEQLLTLLSTLNVNKVGDFQALYRDIVGTFLESGLEAELEDELTVLKRPITAATATVRRALRPRTGSWNSKFRPNFHQNLSKNRV